MNNHDQAARGLQTRSRGMATTTPAQRMPLRPCPFCGTEQLDVEQEGPGFVWRVICLNVLCAAAGPVRYSHDDASRAWNVRITTAAGEPI